MKRGTGWVIMAHLIPECRVRANLVLTGIDSRILQIGQVEVTGVRKNESRLQEDLH
jgi:hypothetical protein